MREFTRIILRIGMILILLGGCVHNIYHFKTFVDKQNPQPYNRYYYRNQYSSQSQSQNDDNEDKDEYVTTSSTYYGY